MPDLSALRALANEFITARLNQLSGQEPGVLNPTPTMNPLVAQSLLPETTQDPGLLGAARHWAYENVVRPMASPLGALAMMAAEPQRAAAPPEMPQSVPIYRWQGNPVQSPNIPDWLRATPEYQATQRAAGGWYTLDPSHLDFYRQDIGPGQAITRQLTPEEVEWFRVRNNPEARQFSGDPDTELFVPPGYVSIHEMKR